MANKARWWLLVTAAPVVVAGLGVLGRAQAGPPPDQIARGAYLARAGDCVACHTAPGGKPYAGGLYINTPFGEMATPNLTPDKETGLGAWTDDQFYRAVHQGIGAKGEYLYPGLPYQWFTRVTRDDVMAIRAYLASVPPVHAPKKPNHLMFPFNIRTGIAGWNALYFKEGTFTPDPAKSADWNRGAYLVEGLGHCGACHTPRNAAQAPIASRAYAGGKQDGWVAPNITSDAKDGIGGWSVDTIAHYLKVGYAQGRGVTFGPMAQTVHDSLAHLNDGDLHAIATYLKTIPAKPNAEAKGIGTAGGAQAGHTLFLNQCASCHQPDGKGLANAVPPLAGNGVVRAAQPQDVIHAVLSGLPAQGPYGPMPGFAAVLTPDEISDVTNYVRASWGNDAPATATPGMVAGLEPKPGTHWCDGAGNSKVMQLAADQGSGLQADLQAMNDTNELVQVRRLVDRVRAKVPGISQDQIVNGLTDSYCKLTVGVPPARRALVLDRFASLVYTAAASSREASQ